MNRNKDVKINKKLLFFLLLIIILNSLYIVLVINLKIMKFWLGISQIETGINRNGINVLYQFKDKSKIFVDGSNIENKLVIIIRFYKLSYFYLI